MSTLVFDYGAYLYFWLAIEDNFNVFGIDVHAGRSDDDFVPPPLKVKVGLLVHLTNVSGAKPAFVCGCCLHIIAPVSRRNIFAAHEDFAVFGQLHLLPAHDPANRAAPQLEWMIDADEPGGFGHAVALNQRKAEPPPKLFGLGVECCSG